MTISQIDFNTETNNDSDTSNNVNGDNISDNDVGDEDIANDEAGTVTRAYLAEVIHQRLGYSKAESSELVDAVIEEIILAMEKDDELKISSFGTFKVRSKKQRIGRNPKTKIEVPVSARKVVSFYVSNLLKKRINGGEA